MIKICEQKVIENWKILCFVVFIDAAVFTTNPKQYSKMKGENCQDFNPKTAGFSKDAASKLRVNP